MQSTIFKVNVPTLTYVAAGHNPTPRPLPPLVSLIHLHEP